MTIMGVIERIRHIAQTNLRDLIATTPDPEEALDEFIQQMESDLDEAKSEMAAAVREERRLKPRLGEEERRIAHWEEKALQAVKNGEDDLARDLIRRKRRASKNLQLLQRQWQEQQELIQLLRLHIEELEEKIQETRLRRTHLMTRHRIREMRRRHRERVQEYAEEWGLGEMDLSWPEPEPPSGRRRPRRDAEPQRRDATPSPQPERAPEPDVELEIEYRLQEVAQREAALDQEIEEELRKLKEQNYEEER